MFKSAIGIVALCLFAVAPPVSATGPAGLGLASDPGDALANALPELARLFCAQAGVGYHAANRIFQEERRKYPKDVPLTLHFRINRAPMSIEDKSHGCVMGFEPQGGIVGPFEPNVLSAGKIDIVAVNATGLGPSIEHFPGLTLRIEPSEKTVPLGETTYFSHLSARFTVARRSHEVDVRPNQASWESSDEQAVKPIPPTAPGTALIMTSAGGAQAQGFTTHRSGRYSVIASLPSGASTYATLVVIPNEEIRADWMVRHRDAGGQCSTCLSGSLKIRFDNEGKAASGKFSTDCMQLLCAGMPPHSLCTLPAEQRAVLSGKLLNLQNDPDARILQGDLKSAAGAGETGAFSGDYQRVGTARPYEYLGSGSLRLPVTQDGNIIGWAEGTWHSNTSLKCVQ